MTGESKYKKEYVIIALCASILPFFLNPILFLLRNLVQLDIGFGTLFFAYLKVAAIILTLFLIPLFIPSDKFKKMFFAALAIFSLWCYFEMFLLSLMGILDGSAFEITDYIPLLAAEIFFVLVITILTVIFYKKRGWNKAISSICLILLVTQSLFFAINFTTFKTTETELTHRKYGITYDNYASYSKDKNIIIIVLDCYGSGLFKYFIEKEPEYKKLLKDFDYYENAFHEKGTTAYAVPAILTGNLYPGNFVVPDNKYFHFLKDTYSSENNVMKILKAQGFGVDVYAWQKSTIYYDRAYIDNIEEREKQIKSNTFKRLIKNTLAFQMLPVVFKKSAHHFLSDVTSRKMLLMKYGSSSEKEMKEDAYTNLSFFTNFKDGIKLNAKQPVFKYYHLQGLHPPFDLDENLNITKLTEQEGDPLYRTLKINMYLLKNYLEKLKAAGLYDKTAIIIMGDHGSDVPQATWDFANRNCNPLLLYKDFGQRHQRMRLVSDIAPSTANINKFVLHSLNKSQIDIPKDVSAERIRIIKESGRYSARNLKKEEHGIIPKYDEPETSSEVLHLFPISDSALNLHMKTQCPKLPKYFFIGFTNLQNKNIVYFSPEELSGYKNKKDFNVALLFDMADFENGEYKMDVYLKDKHKKITRVATPVRVTIKNKKITKIER